jgi:integrase
MNAINNVKIPCSLQLVLEKIEQESNLSDVRKRDLKSALKTIGKLADKPLCTIPLDLKTIRDIVDRATDYPMCRSKKRAANLRSDVAAAIEQFNPALIVRTSKLPLGADWIQLLSTIQELGDKLALSRFARWAGAKDINPPDVDGLAIARFAEEMNGRMLARTSTTSKGQLVRAWNTIAASNCTLKMVAVSKPVASCSRVPWDALPASFRDDAMAYLKSCQVLNPWDDNARTRPLSEKTIRLRKEQIHSAADAALSANPNGFSLTALSDLTSEAGFMTVLGYRHSNNNRLLTAYTHGIAGALIEIARDWVRQPPESIATLKRLRAKLGQLPNGLTSKNSATLRLFDDEKLVQRMIRLPDKLWFRAKRDLKKSKNSLIDLQTSLAIDLLLHVPIRANNLASLQIGNQITRPNGDGTPAQVWLGASETKNNEAMSFELPQRLSDRLWQYRELHFEQTGIYPDRLFISTVGKPRAQSSISLAIKKMIRKELGISFTSHQFRHLAAKIVLDRNPGAYELVRQLLGHKNLKTTTKFYAGIDTKRAGRAHAALLQEIADRLDHRTKPRRGRKS